MRSPFGAFVRVAILVCLWFGFSASASADYNPYVMSSAQDECLSQAGADAAASTPWRPVQIPIYCRLKVNANLTGDYAYVYCVQEYTGTEYAYWHCEARFFAYYAFGKKKICPSCSAEADAGTGNRRLSLPLFAGGGPNALSFGATYNSIPGTLTGDAQLGSMGLNWSHSFQRHITQVDGSDGTALQKWAIVERPDGNVEKFIAPASGTLWTATADNHAVLNAVLDSQSQIIGWTRVDTRGQTETYDSLGRLVSIKARSGLTQTLVYDDYAYGAYGLTTYRLNSVQDATGRKLVFSYNSANQITGVSLPDGRSVAFMYANSRLASVTLSDGSVRQYRYGESAYVDSNDSHSDMLLTGILDGASNRLLSNYYNADHRVTRTHGATVNSVATNDTLVSYASSADPITAATITWPTGGTETQTFTNILGWNRLTARSRTCSGCSTISDSQTFDTAGNPDVTTDFLGYVTDNDYDANGLLAQQVSAKTTADQKTVTTVWDTTLRVPTRVNRVGQQLDFTWNARGQVLTAKITDTTTSADRTTTYTYCDAVDGTVCPLVGLLRTVDGPRTDVTDLTTYTYRMADDTGCASAGTCTFRKGDLWKVTNAASQVTEIVAYDGAGRVKSVKHANNVVTDLEYSLGGFLSASKVRGVDNNTEADDAITAIEYFDAGRLKKITQPDGAFVSFTYDAAERLTDVTDALGNVIHFTLDAAGHRTQEDTKNSAATIRRTLSRQYDALNRLSWTKNAALQATLYTYDANGAVDLSSDPLSRSSDTDVDALGRLKKQIQDVGGIEATSEFEYDGRDNLTKVTDPKALDTTYAYNGFDELVQLNSPDTGTTTYGYDAGGNRTSQLDARGKSTTYTYDVLGRLMAELPLAASSMNVGYIYDAPEADCLTGETFGVGRLAKMTDESGSTRYCYDRRGNLVRKVQTTTGGSTLTTEATYDYAGNVTAMTLPSGAIVVYLRDDNGRIRRVEAKPTATATQIAIVTSATYEPFGPLRDTTFGSGRVLARTYTQDYGPAALNDGVTADGLYETYGLDAVGNVSSVTERTSIARTFTYDGLDRLTALKNGTTVVEGYTYDATGNRTSQTTGGVTSSYTLASTSHRLTNTNTGARTYDANGNTLTIGSDKVFTYDDRNRMREYEYQATLLRTYYYNGHGERVRRVTNTPTTNRQFVYDPSGHLLGEYTDAGVRVAEYVWMDDTLVAVLKDHDGTTYQYVETDHLGTPRAIVNPVNGDVIWRWDLTQTAFGDHAPDGDPDINAVVYSFSLRYPGQYDDGIGGIYYNYFRDYDAGTGRYLQSDPIGLQGGMSTFSYVMGNPLGGVDPLGLEKYAPGVKEYSTDYESSSMYEWIVQWAKNGTEVSLMADAARDETKLAQRISRLKGSTNGPADAFRHCVWSCLLTRKIGTQKALGVLDTHEEFGRMWEDFEWEFEYQDEANNAVGQDCAQRGGLCPNLCYSKLIHGKLFDVGGKKPMIVSQWLRAHPDEK